jgi:hypothetical protein
MKLKLMLLLLFFPLILLTACDGAPTYAQFCKKHSEICEEFTNDSWCKKEKIAVGFANYNLLSTKSDHEKFKLLIAYEAYAKCVDFSTKIEHIKLKHKRTMRFENLVKVQKRIKTLSKETRSSLNPELLYFHWSRYLNKTALAKFLQLEGSAALETPSSQINLATYYTKVDRDKTLGILFHALELYQENDVINKEVFKSISSIFAEKKNVKQAYIWLKILHLYDPKDKDISSKTLTQYVEGYRLKGPFLNEVAEDTLQKITQGEFVTPKF